MEKKSKQHIGIAGEYAVVSELVKRGYVACITDKNTPKFDILAANQNGTRFAAIQVKTSGEFVDESKHGAGWFTLTQKDEEWFHNQETFEKVFYIFVRITNDTNKYWVVNAKNVAKFAYHDHKDYLSTPGKRVQQRKDTSRRGINPSLAVPNIKENNFEDLGL